MSGKCEHCLQPYFIAISAIDPSSTVLDRASIQKNFVSQIKTSIVKNCEAENISSLLSDYSVLQLWALREAVQINY